MMLRRLIPKAAKEARRALPQFVRLYSHAIADEHKPFQPPAASSGHHHHKEGFLDIKSLKRLSDMVIENHDSHLSERDLAEKAFLRLKELEAEVYARIARFDKQYGSSAKAFWVPEPKTWPGKVSDPLFLMSALCSVLFLIFMYNQYMEFAYEMAFEIRDGLMGVGFYFLLGLHGTHVVIGTIMLLILTLLSWFKAVHGQSIYLRITSVYVHLVDLVFIFIVFSIYGGFCKPHLARMVEDHPLPKKTLARVDEAGNVTEEDYF
jgi:hypothetical protein